MNEFTIPLTILDILCNLLTTFVLLLEETGTLILLIIQKSGVNTDERKQLNLGQM
jgi:hypothetical protein